MNNDRGVNFMKKLKLITVVLLCLALTVLFIACGNDEATDIAPNAENIGDARNSENENGKDEMTAEIYTLNLPQVDMNGKTFNILVATWGSSYTLDIGTEEATGDPLDDAAYLRRINVEATYNANIRHLHDSNAAEAVIRYRNSIRAGDRAFDFAQTHCNTFVSLLTGNYLTDFKDLTFIDTDKPWWNRNFYETMSVLGTNYALDGHISTTSLRCVWFMAFNKGMIQDNEFESPFDLVKEGRWTLDKMEEMGRAVARDLNNDGTMDLHDLWGLNYTIDSFAGLINSIGVRLAELDGEGIPQLIMGDETNLTRLTKLYEVVNDRTFSGETLISRGMPGGGRLAEMFSDNRALFLAAWASQANIDHLRSTDVDFGIIPYPKWDEAQVYYMPSTAGNFHPVITVPTTNDDLDNTGIIMEALAYHGWKTITPEFYESLLKRKTARDAESEDMIDYIFGNIQYDIGNMFNFGGMMGVFGGEMATNQRAQIVSEIERNISVWQRAINEMLEEIQRN
jgi:hypothetical protein